MKQLTFGAWWLAFLLVLSACATGDDDAAPPDAATAPPNVVTLSTEGYEFQAPDTIDAGWTTFRFANHGDETHYAHAVRLDSGRTADELVRAYAEAIRTASPRPSWVTRFGGPGTTGPGDSSSVTQRMEPGHFAWICPIEDRDGTPHFSEGEVQPFLVRDTAPNAAEQRAPEASMVIRLMNYTYALETPLSAGQHTIRVENAGPDPHDVALARLAAGETVEDVRTWMQEPQGPPPINDMAGGVAVIAPGMEAFFEADLSPGEYALICFATADDGRTHIEHGMIEQVSVR